MVLLESPSHTSNLARCTRPHPTAYSRGMDSDSGRTRIAVLIDADNTSPRYAEALLDELATYGTPTIKRAYGDFSTPQLQGWTKVLNARAIRAIQASAFTAGKNSSDSALIIDAMDLLYAGNVEAFAIVSSDSDFTSLALRLRESGKTVYGIGRRTTPMSLQNACDKFIQLEVLGAAAEATPAATELAESAASAETPTINLQSALTKAVNATADDDGWTSVSRVGHHLSRAQASFDPRTFGHSKLSSLVAAQPYLETVREGNTWRTRLKGKPAAKKAAPKPATAKAATARTSAKKAAS